MKVDDSYDDVEILDETTELTLSELCCACGQHAEWIVELVSYGVIEPLNIEENHWRFSGVSLTRVKKAQRLERDLGINTPGIALAIELLDELESLRTRIQRYESD
jgi:chaperone modulatory protein CbpM